MEIHSPVMYPAASDARKPTSSAISSGLSSLSFRSLVISVLTYPGATELTVIPFLPTSFARERVADIRPPFAAA